MSEGSAFSNLMKCLKSRGVTVRPCNELLEPTHHIRFAEFNLSTFLAPGAMPQGQRCNGRGLLQA